MFWKIRAKIFEKLKEIESIAAVYNYAEVGPDRYPAVAFEPAGNENFVFSLHQQKRVYKFDIYIYQEYERISKDKAWTILLKVYDDILDKFQNNITLDGDCVNIKVEQGDFWTINFEDWKGIYWNLNLQIETTTQWI